MAKISAHGNFKFFSYDPKDNPFRVKFGHGENEKKRSFLENPFVFSKRKKGVRVYMSRKKSKEIHNTKEERIKSDFIEYDSDEGDEEDEEDEEEMELGGYERDKLSYFRGLVLDISYRPVNVVCWKRAMCLEFMEKADVLEYYDQAVPSVRGSYYIPAVLRVPHLIQVVKRRRIKQCLSRKNIFYRDSYMCQYCSSKDNLTIDHVIPISRGGEWTWENLATACSRCNSRKGHKTPEEANMKLLKTPKAPKQFDILAIPLTAAAVKMLKTRKGVPEEWQQYLGKPAP